jgi:hypothetical protein
MILKLREVIPVTMAARGGVASSSSPVATLVYLPSNARFTFPPELERDILETAALRHLGTIPSPLRVYRQVHGWKVRPFRPRTSHVENSQQDRATAIKVLNLTNDHQLSTAESKEPAFLQCAVRDVYPVVYTCLNYDGEDKIKKHANLFLKCSGTTNLVMDSAEFEFDDLDLLSAVRNMCLQRLSITVPSVVLT